MKNVISTTRIALVATAVLVLGAGATVSSAESGHDQQSVNLAGTVVVDGPDQPGCIGCWD